MELTLVYITFREDPKSHWFFESLRRQIKDGDKIHVIVVDRNCLYATPCSASNGVLSANKLASYIETQPKPNVWSGHYRITKEEWWSASSVRNTGLLLCRTPGICYVDDLSVLMPTWLQAAKEAVAGNYIACGAYQKVKKLEVEDGIVTGFEAFPQGIDCRWHQVNQDVTPCEGRWLFGCSLAGPLEAFLTVNGWPEDLCDGMGFEDCCMGHVLQNAGYQLKYDRRLMTLESEEHHHVEKPMRKSDYGVSPADKSHSALNIAKQSKNFPNSFGPGGIRAFRERTLAGEPFPIQHIPQHEWFTGTPLTAL